MTDSGNRPGSQRETSHEDRKLVTVLFCDIEGSTELGEALDIESLRALLLEFFDAMAAVVDKWGGSVEKYIGDAIVAVFGVVIAHEDDGVRAIRAGLEMQDRLAEINPAFKDRYGIELAVRIGVNTGEVLASTAADALLGGDVFNVAARLEAVAEPGAVVVGERTHNVAQGSFEFESLGDFSLKGKSEPQTAWRALAPLLTVERSFETEMVGRAAELGMLDALMKQAIGGAMPRLVTIIGEAGIGKSRLIREFVSKGSAQMRTLIGRCLPYGQGITFWPLREVLWESAGIALDDTSEMAASKLVSLVETLPRESVVDREWLAFGLATTAGIAMLDNPFDELSPESAGEELQLAWPTFASALASDQPTVMVIEDVHWAERPLLDMIEQLALRGLGPLLIVVTARPEFMVQEAGWAARAIPSQVSLGPLMEESFGQLMRELLPDADDRLRHRVLDSAGGNPFFAQEIARHVADEGLDAAVGDQVSVPDTARTILAARIDQLDPMDREVLQDAAVIGEVFWPAPLNQIGEKEVGASLAVLERGGFITTRPVTSLPGQREMAFRHALMRDVVYQSIPRGRLARTHAAVAEWTEVLAADRRDEFIEVVAHHYSAAAQPEVSGLAWPEDSQESERIRVKSLTALIEAGRAARRRYSIDQAVEYADRALALSTTDRERLNGLELKAGSYDAAARVDEAWPVYLQAIATARSVGEEADVSRIVTDATLLWARYAGAFKVENWQPAALDIVQTRLEEIGEERETAELAALLTGRSGWPRRGLMVRSSEEAKADAKRAISISESIGSKKLLSHSLDSYHHLLWEEGYCGIRELTDRMTKLGSEMVDTRQAHELLVTSANLLAEIGQYEESREVGANAYALSLSMGTHLRIHGITTLTASMVPNGGFAEILETSEVVEDLITEDGGITCNYGGGALVARALALFEQGRSQEGLEAVEFYEGAFPEAEQLRIDQIRLIERVRPFVGLGRSERLLQDVRDRSAPVQDMYSIRARLPIVVLREDWSEAEKLIVEARGLAEPCCAPQMLVFADWAESVRDGDVKKAQASLSSLNEPYTSARLGTDFLGTIPASEGGEYRAATDKALESMGALATLAELRAS
jgi:class 3 adenylate cyclase/tetratricopeptide (TPR) repeat protein